MVVIVHHVLGGGILRLGGSGHDLVHDVAGRLEEEAFGNHVYSGGRRYHDTAVVRLVVDDRNALEE